MRSVLQLAIPCFQGERFLESTLRSLAANRPWVRWHLQDGASTDATLDIARRHASAGDTVISEADTGQADALNRAFAAMGGDIVGFINADDIVADGAAQAVCEFFAAHPDVDLVYGEIEWIDSAGRVTGHHAGRIDSLTECLNIHDVWWGGRQWVQPEVFFRRSLWDRVGPFDTRYRLAFDFDFWVRCFRAGARVDRLPAVLARFRRHEAQKSRAAAEAAREIRTIAAAHAVDAHIAAPFRRRLLASVDYDRYHLGEPPYQSAKPSFLRYLATHPTCMNAPAARARFCASLKSLPVGRRS